MDLILGEGIGVLEEYAFRTGGRCTSVLPLLEKVWSSEVEDSFLRCDFINDLMSKSCGRND